MTPNSRKGLMWQQVFREEQGFICQGSEGAWCLPAAAHGVDQLPSPETPSNTLPTPVCLNSDLHLGLQV